MVGPASTARSPGRGSTTTAPARPRSLEVAEELGLIHQRGTPHGRQRNRAAGLRIRVRFAFWGAEESQPVLARRLHVDPVRGRTGDIALNLNLDMVGFPNYVRFVYGGDGSGTARPVLRARTASRPHVGSRVRPPGPGHGADPAFDGRSDDGPFIAVRIPRQPVNVCSAGALQV